jgi:hypothetical protein
VKNQDWKPDQWEWSEKTATDKTNFVPSSNWIPKRGQWNLNNYEVEKTGTFKKFSEDHNSLSQVK